MSNFILTDEVLILSPLYVKLEKLCLSLDADLSLQTLKNQVVDFANSSGKIEEIIANFHSEIGSSTVLAAILLWGRLTAKDKIFGAVYLDLMHQLIEHRTLPIYKKDKSACTLSDLVRIGHEEIIDQIRSAKKWILQKKEELVSFYVLFANWLCEKTYGYVNKATDPDRKMTAKRRFDYENYILLLTHLPLREIILVKLYYLGGDRKMDEVLSLKISDIHFDEKQIMFGPYEVTYPAHVFEDLKTYLEGRKNGFVFVMKSGSERINHTVPYRALKKAAEKLNLPENFSYKDLVAER